MDPTDLNLPSDDGSLSALAADVSVVESGGGIVADAAAVVESARQEEEEVRALVSGPKLPNGNWSSTLCSSCDRCRSRKTKCDGRRPCGSCTRKYAKANKVESIGPDDEARIQCVYSQARRRGPVPGTARGGKADGGLGMGMTMGMDMDINVNMNTNMNDGPVVIGGRVYDPRCGLSPVGSAAAAGGSLKPGGKTYLSSLSDVKRQRGRKRKNNHASQQIADPYAATALSAAGGGGDDGRGVVGMAGDYAALFGSSAATASHHPDGNENGNGNGGAKAQRRGDGRGRKNHNRNHVRGGNNESSRPLPSSMGGALAAGQNFLLSTPLDPAAAALQQQILSGLGAIGLGIAAASAGVPGAATAGRQQRPGAGVQSVPFRTGRAGAATTAGEDTMATSQAAAKKQLAYLQQLQLQQHTVREREQQNFSAQQHTRSSEGTGVKAEARRGGNGGSSAEASATAVPPSSCSPAPPVGCERPRAARYLRLLRPDDADGSRLRACHALSTGGLFALPPVPSDEEYCRRFGPAGSFLPSLLPKFDIAALQAARFAECALGAVADGRPGLASDLAHASVLCLRDCVEEPVHPSCMFDVARTYFYHAILRHRLGDVGRYFKYRRVSLTHLSRLEGVRGAQTLLAAISFQDSLAYLLHNASARDVPDIDDDVPPVPGPGAVVSVPSVVASEPANRNWIQGAPAAYYAVGEAPVPSRVLDAIACLVRQSTDAANGRRKRKDPWGSDDAGNGSSKGGDGEKTDNDIKPDPATIAPTATERAVAIDPAELSGRNLLSSASSLLGVHEEEGSRGRNARGGHRLLLSAADLWLRAANEGTEDDGGWVRTALRVCRSVTESAVVLHQGGPTYHVVNNAVVYLAKLLNMWHKDLPASSSSDDEGNNDDDENDSTASAKRGQFDEALDVYRAVRVVLNAHRQRLPRVLRCHEIPRPDPDANRGESLIGFRGVSLCRSRACQDRVIAGAGSGEEQSALRDAAEAAATSSALGGPAAEEDDDDDFGDGSDDERRGMVDKEFDLDDQALLAVLGRIMAPAVTHI